MEPRPEEKKVFNCEGDNVALMEPHNEENEIKCEIENSEDPMLERQVHCELFTQEGDVSQLLVHTVDKPFQCQVCENSFKVANHLKSHLVTHTGDSLRPFQCDVCQKLFTAAHHLKTHMLTHTRDRAFQCHHLCIHGAVVECLVSC